MASTSQELQYMPGFGNHFSTEAIKGALPEGRNSPQQCPLGLYAEQLSGTAFTVPRAQNQRTWTYRIRPSVCHKRFQPYKADYTPTDGRKMLSHFDESTTTPNQLRWLPVPLPDSGADAPKIDFVDGLFTKCGAGSPTLKTGLAVHMYAINASMQNKAFCNADGDFLIVPQEGALTIKTELGVMHVKPGEICVVQRLIRFAVSIEQPSRGYVCELYQGHFKIPDLGPIGSNGLANPRDFLTPVASYEDIDDVNYRLVHKFQGSLFEAAMDHSPFDVVAWHGNYAPYKYDLANFNVIGTVSFDHPDPSIFTVLTAPTSEPGVAVCDFAIFPPRWMVGENTFRPPWFHRNVMSEYMGLIYGVYDAKETGFLPGGASLHSIATPHGPESEVFEKASTMQLAPTKLDKTMAFMFESTYMFTPSPFALAAPYIDAEYAECWSGMKKHFRVPQ